MNALIDVDDGKIMPAPGGVLIRDSDIISSAPSVSAVTYRTRMNVALLQG